jgi:hypothetical protein
LGVALLVLPLGIGLAFDAMRLRLSDQPLYIVAGVPAVLGAIVSGVLTTITHRSPTAAPPVRVHFLESAGLYLWLAFGFLMQFEGLTARGGMFVAAVAGGAIVANGIALLRTRIAGQLPTERRS